MRIALVVSGLLLAPVAPLYALARCRENDENKKTPGGLGTPRSL
jgi:hypothetical protein